MNEQRAQVRVSSLRNAPQVNFAASAVLGHRPGNRPAGSPNRIALAIAGDDGGQKSVVARLLDDIGFDAVDAGTIAESWRQQPGTPGYLQDFGVEDVLTALQQARPERTPQWTATDASPGTFEAPR